jgi:hypothetical protein
MLRDVANNCVQAAPDYALLFIDAPVSGAPDAPRWAHIERYEHLAHS